MAIDHLCLGCMSYLENPNAPCPNCGWLQTMKNTVSQLQPGYILTNENQTEKYIIGRALGQGGFGITYLAWHNNRGERVVIKEYFPATISTRDSNCEVIPVNPKEAVQLRHGADDFLKEAYNMLEFVNDPNVVSVKNFFQANNTAYIVMEFIDGQTLKKVMETGNGQMLLNDVLNKLTSIAGVLERMHTPKKNDSGQILRQPMIHHDICPDNIIFTRDGFVKLLDFGTARNFQDDVPGIVRMGYSPPEQFINNDPNFKQGAWTDVYALAATIYHAITGQLPPPSFVRMNSDSLVLPSGFGVQIEPSQEKALLKGLALDYRERWQTIGEFMNALRPAAFNHVDSKNKSNLTLPAVLSSIGGLIAVSLFIFASDMLFEESIFEPDFVLLFLTAAVSTICLGTLLWDIFQLYQNRRPHFLHDVVRQDFVFVAQTVCSVIFLFFTFLYTESWDDSFIAEIQMTVFLNTDLYSDSADALVSMIIFIYSLTSVAGVWMGRKCLRKFI